MYGMVHSILENIEENNNIYFNFVENLHFVMNVGDENLL